MRKRRPRTTDRFPKWTEDATPPALLLPNGTRRAYCFPSPPPIGTCIVSRNHGHQLVGVLDGSEPGTAAVLRWRTACSVCIGPFEQDLALDATFMNARCPTCRRSGPRTAVDPATEDRMRETLLDIAKTGTVRLCAALAAWDGARTTIAGFRRVAEQLVEDCLLVEGDGSDVYEAI